MNIHYRPIKRSDFPFLKKVYRSTREEELKVTGWEDEEKSEFIEFQFNAQHSYYSSTYSGAQFSIIEIATEAIGRLYIWRTKDQIRIIDIALLPKYRGKGIGTIILKQLIDESERSGKKLNIHVEYFNPALKLYERLGFKKMDDTGVYYFMERIPQLY